MTRSAPCFDHNNGVLTRHDPSPQLLSLARSQGGYLSHGQALLLGLRRAQIERLCRGAWQRHARGLYYLGLQEPTFEALAWGGVLLGGEGAIVGGTAAARLWRMRVDEPKELTIWLPFPRERTPDFPYRFRSDRLGRRALRSLPRTSVEDTLLDVCGDPETSVDTIAALIGEACGAHLTTPARMRALLDERSAQPRRRLLLEIVGDTATGTRSALERRYLHDVERAHGLPRGRWQVRTLGAVVDVLYEEYGLIAEMDGMEFHRGAQRQRDTRRDNRHAIELGLHTLRFGWADIAGSPCVVAEQVAATLQSLGWQGALTPCHNCRKRHEGRIA